MYKLYEKNELRFSLLLIIFYVVGISLAENLSKMIGVEKYLSFVFAFLYSAWIYSWIRKKGMKEKYGLISPKLPASKLLYYIPLIIIGSVNLWFGISINFSSLETVFYVLTMLCVGFLEEVLVRGFIFKALAKENFNRAFIISAVAFGLGHLVNLFNGRGMDLLANFLQVLYAIAIGFLFVILFYKTDSLVPSIICHGILNALSAFANVDAVTTEIQIFSALALILISSAYSFYLIRKL